MPYRIVGGTALLQREVVMDALAYCRLAASPGDDDSFSRVYNKPPRGLGETACFVGLLSRLTCWQVRAAGTLPPPGSSPGNTDSLSRMCSKPPSGLGELLPLLACGSSPALTSAH